MVKVFCDERGVGDESDYCKNLLIIKLVSNGWTSEVVKCGNKWEFVSGRCGGGSEICWCLIVYIFLYKTVFCTIDATNICCTSADWLFIIYVKMV